MALRQDYILRLITELGQFVNAAIGSGEPGKETEALQAVMHAQWQLFQESPEKGLNLSLDEQVDLLSRGESPDDAVEKVTTYAAILEQAGRIYLHQGREPLVTNSRILALTALLTAAARWPEHRAELSPRIDNLREQLADEEFPPPVAELWEHYCA